MTMTMTATYTPPQATGVQMYERLLARGNGEYLVTVHRGTMTKITPVRRDADVCAGVERPKSGLLVDNGAMLKKLFAAQYGEYAVKVCHGQIVEVAEVERGKATKVQDLAPQPEVETAKQEGKPGD